MVGWDKLVLQGNVARTAREEAQRKDSGVDRHHHFIGRQKRALIRSRSNRDVGAGDQGNLSPGALENRKVWVSEWSVPGKGKRQCPTPGFWTSSLHGPLPWPRPSFLACLTPQCLPLPISQEQESSKLHHVQGTGRGGGRSLAEAGSRGDQLPNGRNGFRD